MERQLFWTCSKCKVAWAEAIQTPPDAVQLPDTSSTTICEKCLEKMGPSPRKKGSLLCGISS